MNDLNRAIALSIQELRQKAKLYQEDLGTLAQVHRTYISQIERGLKCPTLTVLFKISRALELQPSELIAKIENKLNEL